MKLVTPEAIKRNIRTAINRESARLRHRRKKRRNCRQRSTNRDAPVPLRAPTAIGLHTKTAHHELTKFLRGLRKESAKSTNVSTSIKIDFTQTKSVNSNGMLLMLAEIDRIKRTFGERLSLTCTYPGDITVEKVFQQVGLFSILQKRYRQTITENDKSVFHWNYSTGICVDAQQADTMLKGVRSKVPKGYLRIVTGVEEAMDNAVHHAYIEPRGDRLSGCPTADERRWWVFAEVLDGWLHVAFCDLGLGIPATLPKRWGEHVKDIMKLVSLSESKRDYKMIQRSLELGRTRTGQDNRGKGLKNIAKAAQELNGKLCVFSNKGVIDIDYRTGSPVYHQDGFKRSILGTVIQWSIPITDTQDLRNEDGQN